ncbi:MAG TPA: hypothetical protein PK997_02855 [Candidatus Omnitrophota bacterium]|nr:MAG: hypothetical protein BWY49_00828 [Candidatus Omnitrophica bacterium ADurb.Bin314]HOE69067.1 hypothetical protein [Candidatus Omnitrophota bacterium]HQB94130.1 hypothetical protein [Candidatus Omnitrophota bacterium]
MKKISVMLVLLLSFALMIPSVASADIWESAESDSYKEKVGPMFVRGLLNAATSPVDILVQTVDKTKQGPPLIGTLTGMAGGLGCTALRASSGLVDVGLFWVPGFNGFPVNRSYHNCLLCDDRPEQVEYIRSTPVVQQPVVTQIVQAPAPKPIVTVVEEQPTATATTTSTPVRKVRDPYRYVKK